MAPSNGRWSAAGLLAAGTLLSSCAGLTSPVAERWVVLETCLAPEEAAWAAAQILAEEVPAPRGCGAVPAPRQGAGFLLEARARHGALYRFRAGGGFWGSAAPAPEDRLEHRLENGAPLPVLERPWRGGPGAPFPAFFERFLRLEVAPMSPGRTRMALSWADDEEPVGSGVERQLRRCLGTLEPLAQGNRLLLAGDPVGALAAFDRALAGGDPPGSAFQARLLGRIQFNRGLALARLGALENGWCAFAAAARLDAGLQEAEALAAHTARRVGRPEPTLARAVPAPEGPRAILEAGLALLAGGRAAEARRLLLIARCDPALRREAQSALAEAAEALGDLKGARDHLLHALAQAPGDPGLLAALVAVEERRGAYGAALQLAALGGLQPEAQAAALARLSPREGAARLALAGAGQAAVLGESPSSRVLRSLATGRSAHLSDLRPGAAPPVFAEPPAGF